MVWNNSYFTAIAINATAHKANSYNTFAISYCTFCVGKYTILGPDKHFTHLTVVAAHADRPRSAMTSLTFSRLWLCVVLLGNRSAAENSMFSRTVSIPITMSSCTTDTHAHIHTGWHAK